MVATKKCFKCFAELPLEKFYKHARMADGRLNKCVECTKSDVKKHRIENIEHFRSYDKYRASAPHRVAARSEYQATKQGKAAALRAKKNWAARNPEKRAAQYSVSKALRSGKLVKLHCFVCGDSDTQAHHADYSNALGVTWLCTTHHTQVHNEFKELKAA